MKGKVSLTLYVVASCVAVGALLLLGLWIWGLIRHYFPDNVQALIDQGKTHYHERKYEESAWECSRAIRLDASRPGAYYYRGEDRLALGDIDGAIEDETRAIALDATVAAPYTCRAQARIKKGDLDAAIADCDATLKLDPRNPLGYALRGDARSRRRDDLGRPCDLDSVIQDCTEAIRLYPDCLQAHDNRADARAVKGDLEGAAEDVSQSMRLCPDEPYYVWRRANVLLGQGETERAASDYDKALRLGLRAQRDQEDARARMWIARERPDVARRLGKGLAAAWRYDYAAARSELEAVLQAMSDNDATPQARRIRAKTEYSLGYICSLASVGRDGPGSVARSVADAEATRQSDLAFEHLDKAIDLGLRDKDLFAKDKDLEPLHTDARWKKVMSALQ